MILKNINVVQGLFQLFDFVLGHGGDAFEKRVTEALINAGKRGAEEKCCAYY